MKDKRMDILKNIPEANGICSECLKFNIQRERKGIFAWCIHNKSGGFMATGENGELTGFWTIMSPMTKEYAYYFFPLLISQSGKSDLIDGHKSVDAHLN